MLVALAASITAHAKTLTGIVVSVADGDTVTLHDARRRRYKVRVAGIDAPEKAQPFGLRSKASLADLVLSRAVDVQWNKRDRYRRIVGKVFVADPNCRTDWCPRTVDAGLAQLTAGLAWWYGQYAREQSGEDSWRYAFAERGARSRRAGLWSDRSPTPPWAWRRAAR